MCFLGQTCSENISSNLEQFRSRSLNVWKYKLHAYIKSYLSHSGKYIELYVLNLRPEKRLQKNSVT